MRFVIVGTGIGGGLVPDGKLRLGAFGAAGELGTIPSFPKAPFGDAEIADALKHW